MNQILDCLTDLCKNRKFHEKWLIAPSLRIGRQWLDSLTLFGANPINFHLKTIRGLAFQLAAGEMEKRKKRLVSGIGLRVMADLAIRKIITGGARYFDGLTITPAFSRVMQSSFSALRAAGLTPDDFTDDTFELPEKSHDIRECYKSYNERLAENGLIDYPELLKIATEAIVDGSSNYLGETLIIVPYQDDPIPLETKLLENIPKFNILKLEPPLTSPKEASDIRLLSFLHCPSAAPTSTWDGTVDLFAAIGEINEVREVFRRIMTESLKLDEVEILYTDYDTYAPLLYETVARLYETDGASLDEFPITFTEGVPVRYSKPARALKAFLQWTANDYPQKLFVTMIQDGLLKIPGDSHKYIDYIYLADKLSDLKIGFRLPRYQQAIEERIQEIEAQTASSPAPTLAKTQELTALKACLQRIQELGKISPTHISFFGTIQASVDFLELFAASETEYDNYVLAAIRDNLKELLRYMTDVPGANSLDWGDWVLDTLNHSKVGGSRPQPGKIHADHIRTGGHSGRLRTFIIGMDDSRFPGGVASDPILVDAVAGGAAEVANKAGLEIEKRLKRFTDLINRLDGKLTLSFSCYCIEDDREISPSPSFFSAYRILSNNRTGDMAAMKEWLGMPVSFAPDTEESCLDKSEWWLWRASEGVPILNENELLDHFYPGLSCGRAAAQNRSGGDFGIYDGIIGKVAPKFDPFENSGPVMSVARLETMGKCPRQYFFKYVLTLTPERDLQIVFNQWLDPIAFGNLLHEVFYEFMKEHYNKNDKPSFLRHESRLKSILKWHINKYKQFTTPPNDSAFRRQELRLRAAARVFLKEEEELCRTSRPIHFELSLGLPDKDPGLDPQLRRPIKLALGSGIIRASGKIDRIDQDESTTDRHWIWDYKTGKDSYYDDPDPFKKGRVIQHAFYIRLISMALKKTCDFGYFFPSESAGGRRIRWTRDQLKNADQVIDNLCRLISQGCFIPTNDTNDCLRCDYKHICGDYKQVIKNTAAKLPETSNRHLASFKSLRNDKYK